jgi:cell division transport system permease protein
MAMRFSGIRGTLPLGQDRSGRYVPWITAFIVYVAALAGIALIGLNDATASLDRALGATLTIQVPAQASEARLQTVLGLLRQAHGVAGVHLLDQKEMAGLLEPWLGPGAPIGELPVPRLIDVRITPDNPPDFSALRQHLASVMPEARLYDHRTMAAQTAGMTQLVHAVLIAVIAVGVLLVAIIATYALNNAWVIDSKVVRLVHLLGATDRNIARQFTLRACLMICAGALLGIGAALLTQFVLHSGPVAPDLILPLTDWRSWAVLAGAVFIAFVVAIAGAQLIVRRRLAGLP